VNDAHVLTFVGDLDLSRKAQILEELERIEHFGPRATTILDLTRVSYLDSTFFNALIHTQKHLSNAPPDGRICLVMRRRHSQQLFELMKFDQIFPIFRDLTTAFMYIETNFHDTDKSPCTETSALIGSVDLYRVIRSAPDTFDDDLHNPDEWMRESTRVLHMTRPR
jgi:anti-anti-sigma factor